MNKKNLEEQALDYYYKSSLNSAKANAILEKLTSRQKEIVLKKIKQTSLKETK